MNGYDWSLAMKMPEKRELEWIYSHLKDDTTKMIFRHRLLYSIFGEYDDIRQIILTSSEARTVQKCLLDQKGNYVLFGCGMGGKQLIKLINLTWKCIIDNSPKINSFSNIPVIPVKDYCVDDSDIFVIASWKYYKEMEKQLIDDLGIEKKRIINVGQLIEVLIEKQYFDLPELNYAYIKNFVDVGSYDGQTSIMFAQYCKDYDNVYAFEPDRNNYCKAKENMDNAKLRYELYNLGAWSHRDELGFDEKNSVGSTISIESSTKISVSDIDSILIDKPVSYIKMDIEGAEYNALQGARQIIQKHKPKLAISIYHKDTDILSIPELILSYNPQYGFYLRHYSFGDNDTILYAI